MTSLLSRATTRWTPVHPHSVLMRPLHPDGFVGPRDRPVEERLLVEYDQRLPYMFGEVEKTHARSWLMPGDLVVYPPNAFDIAQENEDGSLDLAILDDRAVYALVVDDRTRLVPADHVVIVEPIPEDTLTDSPIDVGDTRTLIVDRATVTARVIDAGLRARRVLGLQGGETVVIDDRKSLVVGLDTTRYHLVPFGQVLATI